MVFAFIPRSTCEARAKTAANQRLERPVTPPSAVVGLKAVCETYRVPTEYDSHR